MTHAIGEMRDGENENGEDLTSAKEHAARMPSHLGGYGFEQPPGRTRRCGFYVSDQVSDDAFYLIDTITKDGRITMRFTGVPDNAVVVVIGRRYEERIRKAMASFEPVPHPSVVAARMIDEECRKDESLARTLGWSLL